MSGCTLETVTDDGGIDELTEAVLNGFGAVSTPEDVAAYEAKPLAVALRNPNGDIEGGLIGQSVWDWLYIRYLWVAETHRGGGHGRRLVQAAEAEARKRGCIGIFISTYSFQAPAFYEKLGYTSFGQLDDFPKGHIRHFYQKRLAPART